VLRSENESSPLTGAIIIPATKNNGQWIVFNFFLKKKSEIFIFLIAGCDSEAVLRPGPYRKNILQTK